MPSGPYLEMRMIKNLVRFAGTRVRRGFFDDNVRPPLCVVLLLFLFGIIVGVFVGSFFSNLQQMDITPGALSASFWESVYKALFYICLALLFSTSYLGVFLIPALALVRAYSFSCSAASLYAAFGSGGFLRAVLALGVPALLAIPAFLICACDGLERARLLCSLRFGGSFLPASRTRIYGHALFVFVAVAMVIVYDYFVLPILLTWL